MKNIIEKIPDDSAGKMELKKKTEHKMVHSSIIDIINFKDWLNKYYKNIKGLKLVDILIKNVNYSDKILFTLPDGDKRELYLMKNVDKIKIPNIKGKKIIFFNQENQFRVIFEPVYIGGKKYILEYIKGHKIAFFTPMLLIYDEFFLPICKPHTIIRNTKNVIFTPVDIEMEKINLEAETEAPKSKYTKMFDSKISYTNLIEWWNDKKVRTKNCTKSIEFNFIGNKIFENLIGNRQ